MLCFMKLGDKASTHDVRGLEELHVSLSVRGSSTVDLLIYQTLCYAQDDLDHMDVDHYLLKVCGHDEFLNK